MGAWDRIELLLSEMSIEKKSADAGGGAPPGGGGGGGIVCRHGFRPNQCAICAELLRPSGGGANRRKARSSDEWSGDLSIKDELEMSADERNNTTMDFSSWNKKIEDYLSHLPRIGKDRKAGIAAIQAFRGWEAEQAGGKENIAEYRLDRYEHGETYDNYIYGGADRSGRPGPAITLRTQIRNAARQRRMGGTGDEELVKKGGTAGEYDPAEAEMATPEFEEFEEWARKMWSVYGRDERGRPIDVDEKAWRETMYYFASTGQRLGHERVPVRGPSLKEMVVDTGTGGDITDQRTGETIPAGRERRELPDESTEVSSQIDEPLYKTLMRMDVGVASQVFKNQYVKNLESNRRLQAQRQQQIDQPAQIPQPPESWPQQMKDTWKQGQAAKGMMVPAGQPTRSERQLDPQLFRRLPTQRHDRERRRFPTWWDLGFTGNIPFTDM